MKIDVIGFVTNYEDKKTTCTAQVIEILGDIERVIDRLTIPIDGVFETVTDEMIMAVRSRIAALGIYG